jgi:hypothetical protein
VQALRIFGLALLAWCRPYAEYVPVSVSTSPPPLHATPAIEADASGELPSTAEGESPSAPIPGVMLPFFPFFPIPPIEIGRGYDPTSVPAGQPGYPPRYQPLSPAYGPGSR